MVLSDGVDRPVVLRMDWCPIEATQAAWIERPYEFEDIRVAMFDYCRDKALGWDGFTMALFRIVGR